MSLLIRALIPSWQLHPHDVITSKTLPSNVISLDVGVSTNEFWENINMQSRTIQSRTKEERYCTYKHISRYDYIYIVFFVLLEYEISPW